MAKKNSEQEEDLMQLFLEQEANKEGKKEDLENKETKSIEQEEEDFVKLFEKQQLEPSEDKSKEDKSKESKETKENLEEEPKDESIDDKSANDEYNFKAIASYLANEGAIEFEDSEDIENTPEVIREAVIKSATNMVNEYKESLPDVVQDLVDYIEKGGKPEKYLLALQRDIDLDHIDLEDSKDQKVLISEYLKLQGLSVDEIEESIKDFEDGVMLDKQAKIAQKQLKKYYDGRASQLIQEQEAYQKQVQDEYNKYINDVKKEVKSSKDIAGLPISDGQKDAFIKYLLQPDKTGKTGYQKDLEEDQTKVAIELAWLKYNKYDWSKAKSNAKKEVTDELKKMFKNSETMNKGKSGEIPPKQKADDFSSFSKFFGKQK